MKTIGEVYFARVATAGEVFDPAAHAREDLVAFSASFSQVRGDAATIEIECLYPPEGLLAGPRWGILSARVDGIVREIARGQIVNFPAGLAGQTVTVELVCKAANGSALVDNLFATHDNLVPRHVEPSTDPRRSEPYILCDVYHDPIALTPSLDPIAGTAPPAAAFYGEGAEPDVSNIFSMEISITDAPVDAITLTETTAFEQVIWKKVDLGDALYRVPLTGRETYTPVGLADAVGRIALDGGYELMSSSVDTTPQTPLVIYTEKEYVDWATCIKRPARSVSYMRHRIDDLHMTAFITAAQDRREILEIPLEVAIAEFGGAAQLTETAALSDADDFAPVRYDMSYETVRKNFGIGGGVLSTIHWTTRYGVGESVWRSAGVFRESLRDCLHAMIRRAARTAVERAHCVRLAITTTAADALDITLRDRVRIYDARLPGGTAVGKVTGIEILFGRSAMATLYVSCPVSDPSRLSAAAGAGLDGLAEIIIDEAFAAAAPPPYTTQLAAVRDGDVDVLVTEITLTDALEAQEYACGGTDPVNHQIENPENEMPITGLSLRLRDLSPVSVEDLGASALRLAPVIIRLPEGVSL